jgi:hypothetical protein
MHPLAKFCIRADLENFKVSGMFFEVTYFSVEKDNDLYRGVLAPPISGALQHPHYHSRCNLSFPRYE